MSGVQIWISPFEGNWKVHQGDEDRVVAVKNTQKEAIDAGRKLAQDVKGELIIQGMDGQIRERRSYGDDPYPPKG